MKFIKPIECLPRKIRNSLKKIDTIYYYPKGTKMEKRYRDLVRGIYNLHGIHATDDQIFNRALRLHDMPCPVIKKVRDAITAHHAAVVDYSDYLLSK